MTKTTPPPEGASANVPVPMSETRYEIGGVMRCCIASLDEYCAEHTEADEGTEVLCKYEKDNADSGFVLRGNVWRVRLFDEIERGSA